MPVLSVEAQQWGSESRAQEGQREGQWEWQGRGKGRLSEGDRKMAAWVG